MKQRHRAALVDRNTVIFPTNVCHPDEIIEIVTDEMATAVQTDNDNQIEDDVILRLNSDKCNIDRIHLLAKSESTS
jgi:hypothetical protein